MKALAFTLLLLLTATALSSVASTHTDIRSLDFKNFSFEWDNAMKKSPSYAPWHWLTSLPQSRIHVENGSHRFYEKNQSQFERVVAPLVSVEGVVFGDVDGDGVEDAAVHLNYSTGGTLNWDYLYVYRESSSGPKLLGILKAGSRADGGLLRDRTLIQNGLLTLDFADAERRVGDCCSEGYIRVRYRWRDGAFVEEGPRERGDLDLHEH